jgi:hypothetical protein
MRGALRGAVAAWLGLIALHTVGTTGGSSRIAEAFADLNSIVTRVIDPTVPAIPDRRTAGAAPAAAPPPTGAPLWDVGRLADAVARPVN